MPQYMPQLSFPCIMLSAYLSARLKHTMAMIIINSPVNRINHCTQYQNKTP